MKKYIHLKGIPDLAKPEVHQSFQRVSNAEIHPSTLIRPTSTGSNKTNEASTTPPEDPQKSED